MSMTEWPGALDDLVTGLDGSVCDAPSLASILNALQTALGITGVPADFVTTAAGSTIFITGAGTGLTFQFVGVGGTGQGIVFVDRLGAPISGVGPTGGWKTFGDRNQAGPGVDGPFVGLDGTTEPPSILSPPSVANFVEPDWGYGIGGRLWLANGTPATEWVSGTTQINDVWINFAAGTVETCTVSGAGTGPGTWVAGLGINPIGKQVASDPFTTTAGVPLATTNTWTAISGAPTITLPGDGNTYEVRLVGLWQASADGIYSVGFGTSTTTVAGATSNDFLNTGVDIPFYAAAPQSGDGQTLDVFGMTQVSGTPTLTIVGGVGGVGAITPLLFTATRVA